MNITEALQKAIENHQKGDLQQAEDIYKKILIDEPDNFYALHYLGVVNIQRENLDLAIEYIEKAFKVDSSDSHAYYNHAIALQEKGRLDDAITSYQKAIRLNPSNYDAHVNLGIVFKEKGKLDEAVTCYQKALQLNPDLFAAYNNLGMALQEKGQLDDAEACLQKALQFKPDSPETLFNLGTVFMEQGKQDQALSVFDKVLDLTPHSVIARFTHCISQLSIIHQDESSIYNSRKKYYDELTKLHDTIRFDTKQDIESASKAIGVVQPFYLAYQGLNDLELQQIYGNLLCRIMALRYPRFADRPPMPPGISEKPIRIGFVSGYFYNHSIWKIPIKGWIENLDKDRFELSGYYTWKNKDIETVTARRFFNHFVEDVYSFEDLCNIIKKDNLHMLIFPEIGMDPITLKLASLRLSPVQCASWGHPTTSGLPTIDFYLSSNLMEPPDADNHYTEGLIRLPNLSAYYTPPELKKTGANRDDFRLHHGRVLYHCCQSLYKYLPQYDEVFPRIARELGSCTLLFSSHPRSKWITEQFQRRITRAFEKFNLDAEKFVVFLPFINEARYNDLYYLSDVLLDPIGWSGCNSALEAISCDLPVVTLPGRLMRSRDSFGILSVMGIKDTIASSFDEYIEISVRLGKDPEWRKHISKKIAENKHRIYYDKTCISALENFIEKTVSESLD